MSNAFDNKIKELTNIKKQNEKNQKELSLLRFNVLLMYEEVDKEIDALVARKKELSNQLQKDVFSNLLMITLLGTMSLSQKGSLASVGLQFLSVVFGVHIIYDYTRYKEEIKKASEEIEERLAPLMGSKSSLAKTLTSLDAKIEQLASKDKEITSKIDFVSSKKEEMLKEWQDAYLNHLEVGRIYDIETLPMPDLKGIQIDQESKDANQELTKAKQYIKE